MIKSTCVAMAPKVGGGGNKYGGKLVFLDRVLHNCTSDYLPDEVSSHIQQNSQGCRPMDSSMNSAIFMPKRPKKKKKTKSSGLRCADGCALWRRRLISTTHDLGDVGPKACLGRASPLDDLSAQRGHLNVHGADPARCLLGRSVPAEECWDKDGYEEFIFCSYRGRTVRKELVCWV